MHKYLILIVLLSLISANAAAQEAPLAPDWTLQNINGDEIVLSEIVPGKTTVLLFWASWCPYCKALMPHLQSMKLEYGDDLQIVAINFRDKGDPVAYVEEQGFDFEQLLKGEAVAEQYGLWGTPGLLVIDENQKVLFDLRQIQTAPAPADKDASHRRKAAYRAPYWAAETRKAIDAARNSG